MEIEPLRPNFTLAKARRFHSSMLENLSLRGLSDHLLNPLRSNAVFIHFTLDLKVNLSINYGEVKTTEHHP